VPFMLVEAIIHLQCMKHQSFVCYGNLTCNIYSYQQNIFISLETVEITTGNYSVLFGKLRAIGDIVTITGKNTRTGYIFQSSDEIHFATW